MKKVLRILGWLLAAGVLVLVSGTLYSTLKEYTTWYFRVNGQVTVDGHETNGYMHANTERTILLVTRTDGARPETYLVSFKHGNGIAECGMWHPIRFLPTPVRDLHPPCTGLSVGTDVVDAPVAATLVVQRRSVVFTTVSGKKVKAAW